MMTIVNRETPGEVLVSDASGSGGCEAYCGWKWFQLKWVDPLALLHITVK